MLRRLLLPLLAIASTSLFAAEPAPPRLPAQKDLHLFLLAGQSNMAGRGALAGLSASESAPDPRILALDTDLSWRVAADPLHWDKRDAGVGLGKFFARAVAAKTPGATIGLVPAACGGSPISAWRQGEFHKGTNSRPYDDALARARRAMQDGTLKAVLWHQGESDANPQNAPLYAKRLVELVARFRADLGAPDLPFIVGQLGRFPAKPWNAYQTEIDHAHQAVAAKVKNIRYVSSEELVATRDNLHFDTPALRVFGQRYAEAYEKLAVSK